MVVMGMILMMAMISMMAMILMPGHGLSKLGLPRFRVVAVDKAEKAGRAMMMMTVVLRMVMMAMVLMTVMMVMILIPRLPGLGLGLNSRPRRWRRRCRLHRRLRWPGPGLSRLGLPRLRVVAADRAADRAEADRAGRTRRRLEQRITPRPRMGIPRMGIPRILMDTRRTPIRRRGDGVGCDLFALFLTGRELVERGWHSQSW
ncbi:hypothetical protein B0I37DRAFT_375942 [Chaetomium sp. MPI-CAGE-AT-0009]|nr:hypothetical protein B0I37DRAFT_375942 [Chaetomium sp. MPI-CAGE-AT-0009]